MTGRSACGKTLDTLSHNCYGLAAFPGGQHGLENLSRHKPGIERRPGHRDVSPKRLRDGRGPRPRHRRARVGALARKREGRGGPDDEDRSGIRRQRPLRAHEVRGDAERIAAREEQPGRGHLGRRVPLPGEARKDRGAQRRAPGDSSAQPDTRPRGIRTSDRPRRVVLPQPRPLRRPSHPRNVRPARPQVFLRLDRSERDRPRDGALRPSRARNSPRGRPRTRRGIRVGPVARRDDRVRNPRGTQLPRHSPPRVRHASRVPRHAIATAPRRRDEPSSQLAAKATVPALLAARPVEPLFLTENVRHKVTYVCIQPLFHRDRREDRLELSLLVDEPRDDDRRVLRVEEIVDLVGSHLRRARDLLHGDPVDRHVLG